MTLNRWQRIGVIASVIFVLWSGFSERSKQMESGQRIVGGNLDLCLNDTKSKPWECFAQRDKDFETFMAPNWENIGAVALLPVPIFWLFGWIVVRLYRWVKAGAK